MNQSPTTTPYLLWLDDPRCTDATLVGPKSARLARMRQGGLDTVPDGFVLTVRGYREGLEGHRARIGAAYRELVARGEGPVAVRSSATAEDLEGASFAGLQQSVLHVAGEEPLLAAIRQVWASLESPEARAYRARGGLEGSAMAVLVQQQVPALVAGVAFARDPLSGEARLVIEAVPGLGEALVSGQAEPQRWEAAPGEAEFHFSVPTGEPAEPLLGLAPLRALAAMVERAGALFGAPQDVEWAWDGEQMWMLQSRPITGRTGDWFTDHLPEDHALWTAAFLNERFTQPVSPLGWSMIAAPLEQLALRGPLELLGATTIEEPLLKLWRGHPYSRVDSWQRIYKLFPAALLPEDAVRYFPEGDLSLRHAPRQPTLGPHLLWNGGQQLWARGTAASPLHNPQGWARYEQRQEAAMLRFRFLEGELAAEPDPIAAARALLQQVAALTESLLEFHRWSLLYADLFYSLLRRLLALRYGREHGATLAVELAADVDTPTSRMNHELERLAAGDRASDDVERFLGRYGHRSFSLDLYDPPWEADRAGFERFLQALGPQERGAPSSPSKPGGLTPRLLAPLIHLTRRYLYLREAQRFRWQELLALQRRVVLRMGGWWAAGGKLDTPESIFGLTWEELLQGEPNGGLAAARLARLVELRAEAGQAPGWHYPDFLRGNTPLHPVAGGSEFQGRPVSPGLVQGPARLVAHPGEFERLRPGDILVTSSPDPGWTPVFGTVAGMVTERGGQLSHGAVVAREYRLPAVSGIPGLLGLLREGEPLLVDGTQGRVVRLDGGGGGKG